MNSKEYWQKREDEALKHYITQEAEYDRRLKEIYQNMLDSVQHEIDGFFGRYASAEGITLAEAKKRVSKLDIEAYERKAAKYVKEKNFSEQANEEMRLYNLTMKVNRLEMLKANIGLELVAGHDELQKYMGKILRGRTEEELRRQAGILGDTIRNNAKAASVIVNASFHHATFSDCIWLYQDLMKADLSKLLQSGLIRGKNPRVLAREIRKYFIGDEYLKNGKKGAVYHAEILMRTELARVQTEAQKLSFAENGFEEYTFHANHDCCKICSDLDGKHFKVKDMMPSENAAPMHPCCRCSVSAYEDSEEYEAWLDYLDKGGTTAEWNAHGKAEWEKYRSDKIRYDPSNFQSQSFKPVSLDENDKISTQYKSLPCSATKAIGYDNIYISDKLSLKPKQLSYVNARIKKAAMYVGGSGRYPMPRVIICDATELPSHTVAAYSANDNTLRISVAISSKSGVLGLPKDGACFDNHNGVYVHEMLHWSDAQEYIKMHGSADGYLESNIKAGKSNIDKLAESGYDIYSISGYATNKLLEGRFDEVWTEYRTKQILSR